MISFTDRAREMVRTFLGDDGADQALRISVGGSPRAPTYDLTLVDVLSDRSSVEPLEELESRELHAYLRDAVTLLPERQRLVIVGYFLEGRTSQELARFLGVTESRVSQLRSEALQMLKEGIESQYTGQATPKPEQNVGRVARRKATYASAISEASEWKSRLGAVPITA